MIALGPLTNIAALLKARPDLASRIVRLIAVMGRRPDRIFQLGANPLIHLHDMNLRKDAAAGLAGDSLAWLSMWRGFGMKGVHPFDSLAVGCAIAPDLFRCARMPARLVRARLFATSYAVGLFVSRAYRSPTTVTYCYNVSVDFKKALLGVLSVGNRAESP